MKFKRIKIRYIVIVLSLLLTFNSNAVVVSDNDGSAFITKAEFDSLKNTFQSQIDSYNTGIDNKIDQAIASYLAGISIESKTTLSNIYTSMGRTINFGHVPIISTDKKYYVRMFSSIFFQGDGYFKYDDKNALSCCYKSGSTTNYSGEGNYNLFKKTNGFDCLYGTTTGEYCQNLYEFTGDVMVPTATSGAGAVVVPGTNCIGMTAKKRPALVDHKSTFAWQKTSGIYEWYISDPATSGWGNKTSYWSRTDVYVNGTVTDLSNYMSAGETIAGTEYHMIDYDNRIGGKEVTGDPTAVPDTEYTNTKEWTIGLTTEIMRQSPDTTSHSLKETVRYWYPQTYKRKTVDLYSNACASSLQRGVLLYAGLPLFKATKDGKVSFSFKLKSTNAGAGKIYFALVDNDGGIIFDNSAGLSGNAKFTAYEVISGGKTKIGDDLVWICANNSGVEFLVEMKVKKGHEYWFKLKPENLSNGAATPTYYYAYIDNFSNITLVNEY